MKREKSKALITVEAALVLPVFIFVIYFFLYFYQVLMIQEVLHANATKIAKQISSYGTISNLLMKYESQEDPKDPGELLSDSESSSTADENGLCSEVLGEVDIRQFAGKIIDNLIIKERMYQEVHDIPMINSCIKGGFEGILFYGSSLFDEEECVTVSMTYRIRMPVLNYIFPDLPVRQKVRIRSFNGFAVEKRIPDSKETKSQEEQVYITEHGTVYHTNRSCTHLCISISEVLSSSVDVLRNSSGSGYTPCEVCFHKGDAVPRTVYITKTGDRYHKNTECHSLKRYISEVPLSKVGDRRICKRCQNYEK